MFSVVGIIRTKIKHVQTISEAKDEKASDKSEKVLIQNLICNLISDKFEVQKK